MLASASLLWSVEVLGEAVADDSAAVVLRDCFLALLLRLKYLYAIETRTPVVRSANAAVAAAAFDISDHSDWLRI